MLSLEQRVDVVLLVLLVQCVDRVLLALASHLIVLLQLADGVASHVAPHATHPAPPPTPCPPPLTLRVPPTAAHLHHTWA